MLLFTDTIIHAKAASVKVMSGPQYQLCPKTYLLNYYYWLVVFVDSDDC